MNNIRSEVARLKNKIKDFSFYLRYVKPYKFKLAIVLILTIISIIVTIINPYLLRLLIDDAIMNKDNDLMWMLLIVMAVIGIASSLISYLGSYLSGIVTGKVMINIRQDVFNHMMLLSHSYLSNSKVGDLVQKINNEIDNLRDFITNSIIRFIKNTLMIVGCTIALCWINYKLFLLILSVLPLTIIILLYFRPRIKNMIEKIRSKDSDILTFFIERFNNIKLIQSYNTYDYESLKLNKELDTRYHIGIKRIKLIALNSSLTGIIYSLSMILLFSYGGYLIIQGNLTIGYLLAFVNYLMFLMNPAKDMQSLYMDYIRANVSMDRINEILKTITIKEENQYRKSKFKFNKHLIIRDLIFNYDNNNILNNFNVELEKGKTYAIVGPSGSGKSTLMNILMQFRNFEQGEILVDGVSIKDIDIFELREKICFVTQENYLFNDSIIENIKRGNIDSSIDDIIDVCKDVDIDEYIRTLDGQYESRMGDHGSKISGGEKQRLSIARSMLRNNDILILDESFASLDSESESTLLFRIRKRFKGSLILIISHRMSTIKNADEIIFIKNGKVIEKGSHQELILRRKNYFKLFNEQLI
jgi:ABC-type bacteriocin/lantibiotic exporter with double-glycine peptidase domain